MTLTASQTRQYTEAGYVFPLAVLAAADAAALRQRLEAHEAATGGPLSYAQRQKSHLLFTWLADLVRHPAILDPVEQIIGPDILCWGATFFTKEAADPGYVSWHQDATYWGLSGPDVITAWVALTDSNVTNGCMRVVPGSHHTQHAHDDTFAPTNLLSRGQEIAVDVDETQAVDVTLKAGEMSLHHVGLIHGSNPNRSGDRRIGFAIRYIPTRLRQTIGAIDSATLVRGVDRHGHFEAEPAPAADFDPVAAAAHQAIVDRHAATVYAGATGPTKYDDGR